MKKLAILFLLTTVLIGGVFAEASVKANLELANVAEGDTKTKDDGALDTKFALIFAASGTQELGPGALTFGIQLSPQLHFSDVELTKDSESTGAMWDGDDNFVSAGYAFAAGPGTLDFTLKLLAPAAGYGIIWEPNVSYLGLVAGPATLGFGAFYDFKVTGIDDGDQAPFGKTGVGGNEDGDNDDDVGFWVDAKFDFGLYIKYKFVYGIGMEEIKNVSYLDVNYAVMEALVVGVELDATGVKVKDGDLFDGFQVKPYANYTLTENMSAGAYFKIQQINADNDATDLQFSPGVWFKYAL